MRVSKDEPRQDFRSRLRIPAAQCSRVLPSVTLANREGAGNAGCIGAPAALRAKVKSTQASHHRFAGCPGIPCAMVLTVYSVISLAIGLSCRRANQAASLAREKDGCRLLRAEGERMTRSANSQVEEVAFAAFECRSERSPGDRLLCRRSLRPLGSPSGINSLRTAGSSSRRTPRAMTSRRPCPCWLRHMDSRPLAAAPCSDRRC